MCGRQKVAAKLKDQKVSWLSRGQSNLVNTTKLQKLTYRPVMPARRQDSVTRGAEMNFGGAREVYLREFKSEFKSEKGEDVKKKSSVHKFSQTLVFIAKFCDFPRILKRKPKKQGLRPQSFMKSGVSPQKL